MIGSLDSPPIVIRAPRWGSRKLLAYALTAAYVVLGSWLLHIKSHGDGGSAYDGLVWPTVGVIVLGLALYMLVSQTWTIMSPPSIEISPEGLKRRSLWTTKLWAWNEIAQFKTVSYAATSGVGFDLTSPIEPQQASRRQTRKMFGVDQFLISRVEIGPSDLVLLLTDAKARWSRAVATAVRTSSIVTKPPEKPLLGYLGSLLNGRFARRSYWATIGGAAALGLAVAGTFFADPRMPIAMLTVLIIVPSTVAVAGMRARLRDLGLSYWQVRLTFGIVVVAGVVCAINFNVDSRLTTFGYIGVIALGLIVLGAVPGQAKINRFGPPPSF